ncbi:hypothetical protein ACHAXT_006136 [Thalassiosira profunda]
MAPLRTPLILAAAACLLGAAAAQDDGPGGDDPPPNFDMFNQNQVCETYSCPSPLVPLQKWPLSLTSTGCQMGGGGMGMMSAGGDDGYKNIDHCCHQKNACYQLCGSNKQACDKEMEKCMAKGCEELPDSKGKSDMSADEIKTEQDECNKMKGIVDLLGKLGGCREYDAFQRQNCDCIAKDKVKEKMERVLRNFYKKFSPEGIDKVPALVEKTSGKRAMFNKILNSLVAKYPAAVKKKTVSLEDMMKSQSSEL